MLFWVTGEKVYYENVAKNGAEWAIMIILIRQSENERRHSLIIRQFQKVDISLQKIVL